MQAEVIVLTFNHAEVTVRCFKALGACTQASHRLLWVDNGSDSGQRKMAMEEARRHPCMAPVWIGQNLGFVRAVNAALTIALEVWETETPYVVLLNNDVIVTEGWLDRMIGILDREPDLYAVGPVTSDCNSWQSFTKVAGVVQDFQLPNGFHQLNTDQRAAKMDYCYGDLWRPCKMLAFFCTVFRREAFQRLGYLDEQFGMGLGDDDDFAKRMRDAGMRLGVSLGTYVHHDHRTTFKSLYSEDEIKDIQKEHLGVYEGKHGEPAVI